MNAFLNRTRLVVVVALFVAGVSTVRADVPRLVSYQGRLLGVGNGPVSLAVTIYDSDMGGSVLFTETHPSVPLFDGVFAIQIGSETTGGLPDGALDAAEVWLGVSVDGGGELTPRTCVGMVPFAAKAGAAEFVSAPGTFNPVAIATADGDFEIHDPSGNREFYLNTNGFGSGAEMSLYQSDSQTCIRLTAAASGGRLYLNAGDGSGGVQMWGETSGGSRIILRELGSRRMQFDSSQGTSGGSSFGMWDSDNTQTVDFDGDFFGAARLELHDAGGADAITLDALDGFITITDATHTGSLTLDGDEAGSVGPVLRMSDGGTDHVEIMKESATRGGLMRFRADDGDVALSFVSDEATNSGPVMYLHNRSGTQTIEIDGDESLDSVIRLFNANGTGTVTLDSDDSGGGGGFLTVDDNAGEERLIVEADDSGDGVLQLYNSSGTQVMAMNTDISGGNGQLSIKDSTGTIRCRMTTFATSGGQFFLDDENGNQGVRLYGRDPFGTTTGGALYLRDGNTNSLVLHANYQGTGNSRVVTDVVEIKGGADLSEQFDVTASGHPVTAGMIVSIDPSKPGKLVLCADAYDCKVAGIVSGANGIRPGFLMGQRDSVADGEFPVALTGRVWAWCEASSGSIEPGDLLTTSSLPGHAMKVADPARAHGATIGKAMTALGRGRGLVLVLVALQ